MLGELAEAFLVHRVTAREKDALIARRKLLRKANWAALLDRILNALVVLL